VKEKAEEMGKTNTQYNIYAAALKMAKDYENLGLTPEIYYDPLSQKIMVTSTEYVNNRFH